MEDFIKTYFLDVFVNHYFDFKGKTTRRQFWLFVLTVIIILLILVGIIIICGFINDVSLSSAARSIVEYISVDLDNLEYNNAWNKNLFAYIIFFGIISLIISGIVLAPIFSIIARRLHDINKSGLWQLVFWIPSYLVVIMIVAQLSMVFRFLVIGDGFYDYYPLVIAFIDISFILSIEGFIVLFIFMLLPSKSPRDSIIYKLNTGEIKRKI
jgi:uncharacterized membrane protein YhaH (DUF805 family)